MHFSAIVNLASGSVPPEGDRLLQEEVSRLGHSVEVHVVNGAELVDVWANVDAETSDGVIAWGGDGTLSFVLSRSCKDGLPVLPLPGGTMNMLPKYIHGEDTEWKTCLERVLENPQQTTIPGIRVGDEMCYVGVLVGRLTRLAHSREHLRSGEIGEAVQALMRNDVLNLKTRLEVNAGLEDWDATAIGVFVPEKAGRPMDIVSIDPESLGELIETSLDAMFGDWKTATGVDRHAARHIHIGLIDDSSSVHVAMDGEPTEIPAPFSIDLVEHAAQVWSAASK